MKELPPSSPPPKTHEKKVNGRRLRITEGQPLGIDIKKLDLSRYGKSEGEMRDSLSIIAEWVELHTLDDGFAHHTERQAWEKKLSRPMYEWLNNHKYRGNLWIAAQLNLSYVVPRLLEADSDPARGQLTKKRVQELTKNIPDISQRIVKAGREGAAARSTYIGALGELEDIARQVLTLVATS